MLLNSFKKFFILALLIITSCNSNSTYHDVNVVIKSDKYIGTWTQTMDQNGFDIPKGKTPIIIIRITKPDAYYYVEIKLPDSESFEPIDFGSGKYWDVGGAGLHNLAEKGTAIRYDSKTNTIQVPAIGFFNK